MEKQLSKYKVWAVFDLLILGGLSLALFFLNQAFLAAVALVLMFLILDMISKRFVSQYKNFVVRRVLDRYLQSYEYHRRRGFLRNEVFATQLIAMGNQYHSEDYIKGFYKGIAFEMADVVVKDRKRVGRHTQTIDIFKGQWIKVKVKSKAPSPLLIFHKSMKPSFKRDFHQKVLREIQTESVAFNNTYRVFSLRDVDAFYILTPKVIERLNQLETDRVSMYQSGHTVCVALRSNRDILAPRLFSFSNVSEEIYRFEREMETIVAVINTLFSNMSIS